MSMSFEAHELICIGGTGWCKDATLEALKAGYRHLDCAWMYGVSTPHPTYQAFHATPGDAIYS